MPIIFPRCKEEIRFSSTYCPYCGKPLVKRGSIGNGYGIVGLICGIIGLFVAGVIFGLIAIGLSSQGIKQDINTKFAIAGFVLGVVDVIVFIFVFLIGVLNIWAWFFSY